MSSTREQAREAVARAVMLPPNHPRAVRAADAASAVWEPLLREAYMLLDVYDRSSVVDTSLRRAMAQKRSSILRQAKEILGE